MPSWWPKTRDCPGGRDGVKVPGRQRFDQLRAAVTFTDIHLGEVYESGFDLVDLVSFEAGALAWTLDSLECDQLAITPLMRTDSGLVVVNPGELAASLRHHIISTAIEHGCLAEVATVFRDARRRSRTGSHAAARALLSRLSPNPAGAMPWTTPRPHHPTPRHRCRPAPAPPSRQSH